MDYLIRGVLGISVGFSMAFIFGLIGKAFNSQEKPAAIVVKMRHGIQQLDNRTKAEKELIWAKTYELFLDQLKKETKPELLQDALDSAKSTCMLIKFTDYGNI